MQQELQKMVHTNGSFSTKETKNTISRNTTFSFGFTQPPVSISLFQAKKQPIHTCIAQVFKLRLPVYRNTEGKVKLP